jgi:hypothetical protein
MDLHLSFANGNMAGDGTDDIGRFFINGRYDAANRECSWTKTYVGAHDVFYRGFREGKGIWGTWEIGILSRGGFHIWPRQAGEGGAEMERAVSEEPVDAIATQHQLLLRELDFPVVTTSGNLSDEPLCTDEREALERLHGIADVFLVHDRPIVRHVDDAIVRIVLGRELVLRRARGYAPLPVLARGVPRDLPSAEGGAGTFRRNTPPSWPGRCWPCSITTPMSPPAWRRMNWRGRCWACPGTERAAVWTARFGAGNSC